MSCSICDILPWIRRTYVVRPSKSFIASGIPQYDRSCGTLLSDQIGWGGLIDFCDKWRFMGIDKLFDLRYRSDKVRRKFWKRSLADNN